KNNSVANISNSTFFHDFLDYQTPIYVEDSEIHLNNVTLFSDGTKHGIKAKNSDVYISNSYLVDNGEEFVDFCVAYDSQDNPIPFALPLNINNLFPPNQSCAGSNAIYSSRYFIEYPADNGGLTATARLKPLVYYGATANTNPAIHAGDTNSCESTDQRGVLRGTTCDVGAYELNDDADLSVDMSIVTSPPYYSGQLIEYHIEVFNSGPADVYGVDVSISETGLSLEYFQTVQNCAGNSCSISSIANGGSVLIKMFMSVETMFDASVIVEGNTDFSTDPLTTNNFDSTNNGGSIVSAADLELSQTLLTSEPYFFGQSLNYEIEIENLSNASALNVVLTHPTLNGLVAVSHSGCTSSTASTCNITGISGGTTRTINFQATVIGQVISNSVLVSADTHDPNLINNDSQNNNNTANDSNLKLSMSLITSPPYYSSQYVQYSISIENLGPDPATNVTLESVDENLLITDGDANCNILPCVIPVINNGASLNITLGGFLAVEPGNFSHTTSVSSNQNDSNQSNNSVTLVNTISPSADIQVEVDLLDLGPYFVGDIVQFEAKIRNNGTIPATQINVTFPFTLNLQIMDVSSTNCSSYPCILSVLEVGFNNQEIIQVSARITGAGTFHLSAYALANEFDEIVSNNSNSSSAVATVNPNDLIFENGFD
ncbi:MAG: DUF11 domain-containing protein, partial [Proteobacteria bacterium]|nr:DUF11 domain-containing protein [Pseudomonadota bacterium]